MEHIKYQHVIDILKAGISPMLIGPAGSGKTTIAKHAAEALNLPFYCLSMTKQTSVNAIIGFISVKGKNEDGSLAYIPSQFREAYENGGVFLLDEIDAADPNVVLTLNTIDDGFMSFPDGVIQGHKDFKLISTANPSLQGSVYTGRSQLDYATLDRFHKVTVDRDPALEANLTSPEIARDADEMRSFLESQGATKIQISMRDSIRSHKLVTTGIDTQPFLTLLQERNPDAVSAYHQYLQDIEKKRAEEKAERIREAKSQHEMETIDEVWEKIQKGK